MQDRIRGCRLALPKWSALAALGALAAWAALAGSYAFSAPVKAAPSTAAGAAEARKSLPDPSPSKSAVPADHAEQMERGMQLFSASVRPVLLAQCVNCHGGQRKMAGFDVTTRETLLRGGSKGPAVLPGKARESRLYRLVAYQEQPHMPLGAPKLSARQIADLAAWIDLGAPFDKPLLEGADRAAKRPMAVTDEDRRFWSFRPLQRPAPPKVKNEAACRNEIDRFVIRKLEEKGLALNPLADRRKLIRRAYFDLVGLPPRAEEVEAFVRDPAPDAYPKLIDRLLDNPHYGERWARHWLDVARFAESHGFEHDYDRPNAYHYRDFVIKALNQDLPYSTFVKWQIAGDEIEPENPLALAATGFLAAGVHSTQITASQVEKERYDELDDMTRTLGTAMLGLTVGCARCHDHKYDPIPVKDYYRLLSTFTTTVRSDYEVKLDSEEHKRALARWEGEHAPLAEALKRYDAQELPSRLDAWLSAHSKEAAQSQWIAPEWASYQSKGGATLTPQQDGSLLAGGKNPDNDAYTLVTRTRLTGITAVRLEALADSSLVKGGPGRGDNGNFALSDFRVTAAPLEGGQPVPVKLVRSRTTFEQAGLPVQAAIDADRLSSWAVDPQFGKDHAAVFETETPVGFPGGTALTFTLEFNNNQRHSIGRPRLSLAAGPPPAVIGGAPLPESVARALIAKERDANARPSDEERAALRRWYGTRDPGRRELAQRVEEHQKAMPTAPTTKMLISSEGVPAVRLHTQGGDFLEQTHFLKRGDPNQKDGVATQGFLTVLTRAPEGEKHWQTPPPPGWRTSYRRKALAEWVTDVDSGAGNLLARVIVNRLWQHLLGRGIVGTPSDFGLQGERPTHPELLDWLADRLVTGDGGQGTGHGPGPEDGRRKTEGEIGRSPVSGLRSPEAWRLKPIIKLIMTSAVYMQNGDYDAGKAKADPDNRLLWRRTPRRLEAEIIRDALLSVSGTLDETMFGPGTLDETQKRRSVYFMVKRSRLVPTMVLFDAPDALQGLDRRATTTIAPQALLLMNNPTVRGYAEALARRIGTEGGGIPDAVRAGYMTALGRQPTPKELSDSARFVEQQTAAYRADGKTDARVPALADFCQVLMCMNEFVYVD
jgi:mono/diheme cytochrome c family protein